MPSLRFLILLFLTTCLTASNALADEVYVGNQPFPAVRGSGQDLKLDLAELGKALKMTVRNKDGQWTLAGLSIEAHEEGEKAWVSLSKLPSKLIRVTRSPELKIVDIFRVKSRQAATDGSWGGEGELVFFYVDDSEACKAMEGTIQTLEKSRVVRVTRINLEGARGPAFREYSVLFSGDKVPHFVLIDSKGYVLHSFSDFRTYSQMLDEIETGFSKAE